MIRFEFTDSSILEQDIHPHNVYDKELEIARLYFDALPEFSKNISPCPICGSGKREFFFAKWGFSYFLCPETWTVSLSSAPTKDFIDDYYKKSELAQYRASEGYQNLVTEKRRDLWESLVGWVEGRISRYLGYSKYLVADWGSRHIGWIQFLNTAAFIENLQVVEPLPPINEDSDQDEPFEIIFLLDVIQRERDPVSLLKRVWDKLKPGGILIASCRAGSGFDVLTLKERSSSIFPLDHITLPSPQGMEILLQKTGFEVLEITTPGLLDMKLIQNDIDKIPRDQFFLRYIFDQHDQLLLERMQGFLQRNNLSSHLRCVARKK